MQNDTHLNDFCLYSEPVHDPAADAGSEQRFTTRATFLVAMLGSAATDRQARELAALGLSPKAHGILTLLRSRGAQAQNELSRTLGASASAVVALVDALQEAGLVRRGEDPHDRRRNAVEITAAGRRTAARADAVADRVEQEFLAPLPPEEHAALRSLLHRLHTAGSAGAS